MKVTKSDGTLQERDDAKIMAHSAWACRGLDVCQSELDASLSIQFYEGMPTSEIAIAQILTAQSLISLKQPEFDKVTARFVLQRIYKQVTGGPVEYPAISKTISKGVSFNQLDPRMNDGRFDMVKLNKAIDPERDDQFDFLGIQTVFDRYLLTEPLKAEGVKKVYEMPQHFFMRVAMGLALLEDDPTARAIEFYDVMSKFEYMPSTPTLFNSGTKHSQMSSCYLNYVPDDLADIFDLGIKQSALLSKFAGGVGTDWTEVRGNKSVIHSTNGKSNGIIPFLKIYNQTAVAVNQGGKRKGAFAPYLENWHIDFFDFCDLRLQTGEDNLRCHDIHPAAWVPDLFMKRKNEGKDWSFFCPSDVPGLHDLYGEEFERAYEAAEAAGLARKVMPAMDVWKYMLDKLVRTGYPWITWKDRCNERNPQAHCGVVHNSNLCCVSADQRAATDKGLLTVAELYAMQEPVKVSARNGEIKQGSVMYLPRPDAPMVEIQTKQGFTHKVTPDHKVWVVGKGRVEAQHLVDGDKIELQTVGQFGIEHDPALAFIMGLVAGDGTYSESGVRIDLWKGKTDHLKDEVEAVVAAVIARHYKPVAAPTPANLQPKFKIYKKKISLDSSALAQVLSKFGFCKKTKHSVPTLVWQGTRETVVQYLRGLYLTDATTASGSTNNVFVVLAQANERLLKDVQMLWLNLGVISSLTKMRDASKRMMPDGKGGKKEYECQAMYRLGISSSETCNIVESLIGIGAARNNEMFLECLAKPTRNQNQKTYCTFTHLVELPNEDAYCLQVESDEHVWTVNGMISSNTEITLINNRDETAVCNLGSIVLGNHVRDGVIDSDKLARTTKTAMRMLDNVIDLNYYPTPQTSNSNLQHRPVGLGVMGYSEAMLKCNIDWESYDHLQWADELFEQINFYAIRSSMELSKERGAYPTFQGSTWSQGKLTIDTARDQKVNFFSPMEWQLLREDVVKYGMRNSNLMAIAPTATIANIVGTTECIQPINEIAIEKKNLSGTFLQINPLHKFGKPELVKTVWDISQIWLVRANNRRQKWVCQSQSLNLYRKRDMKGRDLDALYTEAWEGGSKTTYYLRNQGDKENGGKRIEQAAVQAPTPAEPEVATEYFQCEACQ